MIQCDLKVGVQCAEAAKKANRILGCIYRSIEFKNKDIILRLHKALVRPHLEYAVQAWRPYLVKDISKLESVQHRATRMISGLKDFSYEDRLKKLNITTLETRRLRGDLIEVFKMVKGFTKVDFHKFFTFADYNFRCHKFKLTKNRFNKNIGKFTFVNRVINEWNLLTDEVVSADSVNCFKNRLDKHLKIRGFI